MIENRAMHQWNRWLAGWPGRVLLDYEQQFLLPLLKDCYGNQILLIGVPGQYGLLKSSVIPHQVLLTPIIDKSKSIQYIESDFYELPIASTSIDLVLVPHVLEYTGNPQHLLAEACRVVKPEGHIIILGFNPYSLWGLKSKLAQSDTIPWAGSFFSAMTIKKWLTLLEFELIMHESFLFRPPIQHHNKLFQQLKLMEWLGEYFRLPWGGIYILMAKAKVIPLVPIKLRWKQKLASAQMSCPISTRTEMNNP